MSENIAPAVGFPGTLPPEHVAPVNAGMYPSEKQRRKMPAEFFSFDEQYLRRLKDGDYDTESHFFRYFSGLLRAKLHLRVRCVQDLEDLRQEVFLRVLKSLRNGPGLQHPGKLGAFVNAVCNNVLLEYIRSKSRTTQLDDEVKPIESTSNLERELLSEEAREQVRVVLNHLPEKDRGLLRAIFLEERDKDAVCKDFGVQRDYLRVLLYRARHRLRDLLTSPKGAAATARNLGGAHQ